ncbi:cysteine desulfurase [Pullulanibacillus pueri]|uniref:Aminotransferase V n=1 Tax=Pullulanibacillus pueri TaxID=1437324 RepID=A0A8J2ZZC7_9BACL|nr:cysteine desulfurase family protein [Pullulanibacillus pueri]MBM7683506.1 cysteine desulfurase [Pullulanibacillus pueri]GGH86667.1 aminotransferase V [Pullulanibacillus pueri]
MIYLDNSATTPPYPEVLETYRIVSERFFANPSSIHRLGGKSEDLLNKSRQQAADLLGVKENEVIFTSGGTEGNNFAIKGAALKYRHRGQHLITTRVEHPASRNAFEQLEALGFEVTYLEVDENGRISVDDFKEALREDTLLVSIIHVNNELGTIQPVKEIGKLLKSKPKTLFHVDHVQGLAKVPLNFKESGIDLCTVSGHKIHGPKGTGILYVREGVSLEPLLAGGGQEFAQRSGTENLPAIAGMVKALRITMEKSQKGIAQLESLNAKIREALESHPLVTIHSNAQESAPHILNATVKGIRAEVLIHALEEEEIYISTKSACSSKDTGASEILLACHIPEAVAKQAIRISMSFENTEAEINTFIAAFKKKVGELEKVREA